MGNWIFRKKSLHLKVSKSFLCESWMNSHQHRKKQVYLSSRCEARAFNELRRYHTRHSWFNWGPKNVHFGKTHFKDLNIDASPPGNFFFNTFFVWLFSYCTLKYPKKRFKLQNTGKNDQIVISTSHIRTVQKIVLDK